VAQYFFEYGLPLPQQQNPLMPSRSPAKAASDMSHFKTEVGRLLNDPATTVSAMKTARGVETVSIGSQLPEADVVNAVTAALTNLHLVGRYLSKPSTPSLP
jgi:hypothetical protein